MPSFKTLGILEGVAKGFEGATDTLLQISVKKQQLDRESETFDINMDIKKLQLKKLENQMDPELLELQNKEMKDEIKAKNAYRDFTMTVLNNQESALKKKRSSIEAFGEGVAEGAINTEQDLNLGQVGEADQLPGFGLAGLEFDLEAGLAGKPPIRRVSDTEQRKRAFDTDVQSGMSPADLLNKYPSKASAIRSIAESRAEVEREKFAGQELTKQPISEVKKGGFFGLGQKADEATNSVASEINTFQDLINLVENQDALKERGVDVDLLLDYYDEELLKLAGQGFLEQ